MWCMIDCMCVCPYFVNARLYVRMCVSKDGLYVLIACMYVCLYARASVCMYGGMYVCVVCVVWLISPVCVVLYVCVYV